MMVAGWCWKGIDVSRGFVDGWIADIFTELYTDESPGLKVDPVVVLVLSLVFIFSVVALHSMWSLSQAFYR